MKSTNTENVVTWEPISPQNYPESHQSSLTFSPGLFWHLPSPCLSVCLSVSQTVYLIAYQSWKVSVASGSVLTGVYDYHRGEGLWQRVWTGQTEEESKISRNLFEKPPLPLYGWRIAAQYFTAPALSVHEHTFICHAADFYSSNHM